MTSELCSWHLLDLTGKPNQTEFDGFKPVTECNYQAIAFLNFPGNLFRPKRVFYCDT